MPNLTAIKSIPYHLGSKRTQISQLHYELKQAASAATDSLDAVRLHRDQILDVLSKFENAVETSNVDVAEGEADAVRDAVKAFGDEYDKLRRKLNELAACTAESLSLAYTDLFRDVQYVTVMLFGRTRAGKSTTMEALTGGNGSTIGMGRQHTTTEVKAYYFPASPSGTEPDYPCLRIVDTPGIEGFEGNDLAAMAEEYVERSDHILYLITDDKATAGELDRFGFIRTQGKNVTVLLNVKASDEDLDLLIDSPCYVFKTDELDGHKRRISSYLKQHFDMTTPEVIPFHARAAWLARSKCDLFEGVADHERLADASRIAAVEQRILRFIKDEAIPARIRTPRDLMNSHLYTLKNELRPFAGRFKQMMHSLDEIAHRLNLGTERACRQVTERFPLLRARFQTAIDSIPGMVDEVIAARGYGRTLDVRWSQLLLDHGVSDCVNWFVGAGRRDFEKELAEEVRLAAFDFSTSGAADLGDLLGSYHEKDDSARNKKYARAALRTGADTGVTALTGWAIFNWWNPTGWAAAAAAGIAVSAGIGAEMIARSATDEWERSTNRDLYIHRGEIIRKLRERLLEDSASARTHCEDWLYQTKSLYLNTVRETARPVQQSSKNLWRATVAVLQRLDGIAAELDHNMIEDILQYVVPEVANGHVTIERVARQPGFATKILISSRISDVSALGTCIGVSGKRIRKTVAALGGEKVDLVDHLAPPKVQVLQALGMVRLAPELVMIVGDGSAAEACVSLVGKTAEDAIGPRGANVRLASQLLNMKIKIGTN